MTDEECLVVILDSEGEESQEMAAICFDTISLRIKDVYLNWANLPSKEGVCDKDWFSRKHVHGLNREFLANNGLTNEDELIADFQTWLKQYHVHQFYGNAPAKEECMLNISIVDVHMPDWTDRSQLECFRMAHLMKALDIGVKGKSCSRETVHCEYSGWSRHKTSGDRVRQLFGHHCALYDCVMILLYLYPKAKLFSS